MKIINTGTTFDIFDDGLKTYDRFPAQSYVVRFSENTGYFLEKYVDIEIKENKIYGVHNEKVNKVLNSFEHFNRNLGVILSGDKGIGKSLFAKLLAIEAMNRNIPLIVVDRYYPGINSYIERIDQEVMILFDEFDKTFGEVKAQEGQASPQAHLLSLFDGVSGGKKLFVVTCNDLHKLNDFLVNRPGRFHYHFRFNYPNANEIREYLQDKLSNEYHGEIDDVIAFSRKVNLNYDCLRAIAFEINTGITFKEAIQDLNIINMNEYSRYNLTLHYENGMAASYKNVPLDFFSDDDDCKEYYWLYDKKGNDFVRVEFAVSDAEFDNKKLCYIILPEYLNITYSDDKSDKESVEAAKKTKISYLSISRRTKGDTIHYAI